MKKNWYTTHWKVLHASLTIVAMVGMIVFPSGMSLSGDLILSVTFPILIAGGFRVLLTRPKHGPYKPIRHIPALVFAIIACFNIIILFLDAYQQLQLGNLSTKDRKSFYMIGAFILPCIFVVFFLIWKMYIDWRKLAKRA